MRKGFFKILNSGIANRVSAAITIFICIGASGYFIHQGQAFTSGIFLGFFFQFVFYLVIKGIKNAVPKVILKHEININGRSIVYTVQTQDEESAFSALQKMKNSIGESK